MKSKFWFILFIASFAIVTAFSQKQISEQSHAWAMYFGNHRINEYWGIHTEYQWRRADFMEHWQQSLLRLGIDYYAKNGSQYTFGYGWIESFAYGEQPIARVFNEHRIWEQFITKSKLGRIDFQHRYRLEQRWLENWLKDIENNDSLGGYIPKNRARYRIMATIPINRKEMTDNTFFISLYDEVFLGFGPNIAKNVMDQNRLYAAMGWKFNSSLSAQIGYLNQYIIKSDAVKAERNHTFQLAVSYNIDFRNKGTESKEKK